MTKQDVTTDNADSFEGVIGYCHEQGRVCPMHKWNELWELLPDRQRAGAGWEPALPLILGAWGETSNEAKAERLAEHVVWADKHGNLSIIANYLRALPESDWHHAND
jgi:hypothetical protein